VSVDVAAVDLDVVDAPFGEGLGIGLEVAEDTGVTSARVVAVVLVDAELQTEIVNLKKKNKVGRIQTIRISRPFTPVSSTN
jgi:hypothetical protein